MDAPPVQYVTTSDGFSIAYAVSGDGPPFVLLPGAFSHIQFAWKRGCLLRPWMEGLARRFRLVQFDGRGKGMSSRGLPADFTAADCYQDFVAVLGRLHIREFVLMATTQIGSHVALTYAIENPEQIRALILGSPSIDGGAMPHALGTSLAEEDWDTFLHSMATLGGAEDFQEDMERLKHSVTQRDWLTYQRVGQKVSLEKDLPQVRTPTLVLHPRDFLFDLDIPMKVAAAMPNARFVVLDDTHLFGHSLEGLQAIDDFLAGLSVREERPAANATIQDSLSAREVEVLRLIARGRSNPQIALELVISVNTVQNHVSSILAKAGLANRAEASSYAQHRGLGPE